MKIRKISIILAIVLMLNFMSIGAMAAETTHNISDGTVIITDACGEECPGHIITGLVNQYVNNIRITGGTHNITLKELEVYTCQSDGSPLEESEIIDFAALYIKEGTKANITVEGNVNFTCDYGIYAPGTELTFHSDAESQFQVNGKRFGIYADGANITFEGGSYYVGTDGSSGIINRGGICADTFTVKNAKLEIQSCDVDRDADCSTIGIDAKNLTAKDSTLDITAMNAHGGTSIGINVTELFQAINSIIEVSSGNAKESYGLYADDLTVTDSEFNAIGGDTNRDEDVNYSYSEGIFAGNIKGTDSHIFATGGNSVQSDGVRADTILLNGGIIQADADKNSAKSYGIFLNENPSFTLIGADMIASGATQNVCVNEDYAEGFQGIVYKADENAEPQAITDLVDFNGYFGNPHKLIYHANGVDAAMPETEIYYNSQFIEITETVPTAEGYTFLGWSENPNADIPEHKAGADSSTSMGDEDITLYAIWQCNGGKGCILERFADLTTTSWYHDGIHYCVDSDIMEGMSKAEFGPDVTASRAMIVTTLYRLKGEPEVTAENTIPDVPDNKWYTDAMIWAAEADIVKGYPDGTFAPDKVATREELTAILYRYYAEYYEEDPVASDIPDSYTDKADVSAWAAEAMAWAIDAGIISGVTDTALAPQSNATRAQLATVLQHIVINVTTGEE